MREYLKEEVERAKEHYDDAVKRYEFACKNKLLESEKTEEVQYLVGSIVKINTSNRYNEFSYVLVNSIEAVSRNTMEYDICGKSIGIADYPINPIGYCSIYYDYAEQDSISVSSLNDISLVSKEDMKEVMTECLTKFQKFIDECV